MFSLAISYLITFKLPLSMDLTFQVPMQYCSLQHWTLLPPPVTSTTGYCLLWLCLFILSGVIFPLITSRILGTYNLGSSSFSVLSFCLHFLLSNQFSQSSPSFTMPVCEWPPFHSQFFQVLCLEFVYSASSCWDKILQLVTLLARSNF